MAISHWIVFKNLETEARRLNLFSRAQVITVADVRERLYLLSILDFKPCKGE